MGDELLHESTDITVDVPLEIPTSNAWQELGDVLWLSLPIIVTMVSYTVMNFADALMVGRHNDAELAAVGAATSVFFLISSLMMGTLSITNTFVSQSVGRGRKRDAPGYVWQALYLALIWGGVALCLSPLAPRLFAWAGHEQSVQKFEVVYLQYMLFRVPAVGFWYGLSAFYQATRRSAVPMVAALIGNGLNILGNYVLIFGKWGFPEMGIEGAALATVLSSYVQAALMMAMFLGRRTDREYGSRGAWRLNAAKLWRMVRFGLPAGVTWCLENAGWTLFLLKIVGELGRDALAANTAALQIIHLSFMPVVGLNIGVQAIVARHIGMKDYAGAKRRAYRALALAVGFMATMGVIFMIFRRSLIGLFCTAGTGQGIIEMGSTMLIFGALFQAFDAVAIVCYGGLKGAGDTRFPMFATIFCSWFVFVPLAWLLTIHLEMGVAGAWLSIVIFVGLLAIINFWRFASEAWHKIDIFEHRPDTAAE